jgi:hypothetical protein
MNEYRDDRIMEDVRIILSALWVMLMLIYLLGDVMRIVAGDFKPGEIEGKPITQWILMFMAIFMLIPIVMVFLSLTLPQDVNRWANIIVPAFYFLFNVVSIRTYPGAYDRFLLIVSIGFNMLTVWYAWSWI